MAPELLGQEVLSGHEVPTRLRASSIVEAVAKTAVKAVKEAMARRVEMEGTGEMEAIWWCQNP